MCHFITAILPGESFLSQLNTIGQDYKLAFSELQNPYISVQLRPGEVYVQKDTGMCDCGTALGSDTNKAQPGDDLEKERKKLLKKGWSESKISRALNSKHKASAPRHEERIEDAKRWLGFINQALAGSSLPYITLILHWYSLTLESEPIRLMDCKSIHVHELSADLLFAMKEDVAYKLYSNWSD